MQVYLRNYKKVAIIATFPRTIKCTTFREIISEKSHIPLSDLALFCNGKHIDAEENQPNMLELHNKSIIHLVNMQRIREEIITVYFKASWQPDDVISVEVKPATVVRTILEEELRPVIGKGEREVFLAYLGRPLNIFKTFEELMVENQAEIMIMELKREEIRKQQVSTLESARYPSIENTVVYDVPVFAGGGLERLSKFSKKAKEVNDSKAFKKKALEATSTTPLQKPKDGAAPIEEAAPGEYEGFDPHSSGAAAPPTAEEGAAPATNPEDAGVLKPKDLIFSGDGKMEETENLVAGAAKEMKENMFKKKSGSSRSSHNSHHSNKSSDLNA